MGQATDFLVSQLPNPSVTGSKLAFNTYVIGSDTINAGYSQLVFGPEGSAPTVVDAFNGLPVTQTFQKTASATFQAAATSNGNGTTLTTDGYDGQLLFLVSNGTGSCSVTFQGSYDNFATAQDVQKVGLYLLSDSSNGTNTARQILSGVQAIAANISYAFLATELWPYMRAVISGASGLGAGSNVTGCTVKVYQVPN